MTVRLDSAWAYHGFTALVLENSLVRIVILPELGAKIWSIVYKPVDREMLWHNPRFGPRPVPYGARYDDWFCGGWDELFPNDPAVTIDGDPYPDHGELWSMPYQWEIVTQSPDEVTIRFSRSGVVTPTSTEKWITLARDQAHLNVRYRFVNDGSQPLHFIWKMHPALAIGPDSRMDLPANAEAATYDSVASGAPERLPWPNNLDDHAQPLDLSIVPPASAATTRFFVADQFTDGWCALTSQSERVGFGFAFDSAILKAVWVFGAYGGWRGLYTTLLEPATSAGYDLGDSIRDGTCTTLGAGEQLETEVTAVCYHGFKRIGGISRSGIVVGEA